MDARSPTLSTRIEIPRLPAHTVTRTRLLERLSGDDSHVCVMAAGLGTGKRPWPRSGSRAPTAPGCHCTRISINANASGCTSPPRCNTPGPAPFDATEQLAIRSRSDSALFVAQLLDEAAALRQPLAIVLEDLHALREPAIIAFLTSVIEGLPPQLQVVVTSRSDPALPLARWRARSWLVDIRQHDLEFTADEVKELFAALGEYRMTGEEVVDLQIRTEGWVAALILTALAIRDGDDGAVARGVTGSNRMIADLLAGEIIDRQPDDVYDLMLCSSIADDFDADLCDILAGRNDSRSRLEALERETHFVVTVDENAADVSLPPPLARPVPPRNSTGTIPAAPTICTGSPLEHSKTAARS